MRGFAHGLMAGAAQDKFDTISNLSGDTFLLDSGDEADLENFVQSNRRTSPATADVLDASTNENSASYAAIARPRVTVEENMPPRSARYRDELYLSSFERTNFHPENVTPDRPCTAYFNSGVFTDSSAVFQALRTQGFPAEAIRCLQRKPTGDMLITFANARMKNSFLEKNVMQIRHRRFAINDEDRQLTYLNIYDAPHELSDNALIRRLEPFCEVVHYRRGRYPTNKSVFNGNRHYRVRRLAAIPSYLRFGKFLVRLSHDGQEHTCRKCNRRGHFAKDCPNTFCFNCEELGHKAESCPSVELCCICKHHSHRARYCPYSWYRQPSPPGSPAQNQPEPTHDESQREPEQTSLVVQLPPTSDVPAPTDVPPPTGLPPTENSSTTDVPITEPDASDVLDSEGLLVLRHLFSDDDDDDLQSVETLHANPDADDSSSSSDADESGDDDMSDDVEENDDDHDNDMDVPEAGTPESASAGPAPLGTPVSASAETVPTPPDLELTEPTDDSLPVATPLESQPLFSSLESQPLTSSNEPVPKSQRSQSKFGPIRRSIFSRRNPAPLPEALAALHRKATAPAPIPTGSAARSRSPDPGDPPDASPSPPDPGMSDPGPAT